MHGIARIISGGQSGADRAALDAAIALGIPHGGYVPAGRRAEDGRIDERYDLIELASDSYDVRTERNVVAADATLILSLGPLTGGSRATQHYARRHDKPVLHLNLARTCPEDAIEQLKKWLADFQPRLLNIAGPRESTSPGIYRAVCEFLLQAFANPQQQDQRQSNSADATVRVESSRE